MITLALIGCAAAGGFTAGACWEACRTGGTLDLRRHLRTAPATVPSNVRVLPTQRGGAA